MAPHPDYPRTRLYIEQALAPDVVVTLDEKRAHYLLTVLRRKSGDAVALFNGREGEWLATLEAAGKKNAALQVTKSLRKQSPESDLWLLTAPLKGGKTEWVVEKATELGVSRICPVATQFTIVDRLNEGRLNSIAVEAAEQCERLSVPVIDPLTPLTSLLGAWPKERLLIFGDESGAGKNAKELLPTLAGISLGLLIGPEGGFSATELETLRNLPYVSGMCMGPRVMRADTATVAALALLQAWSGGWDGKPAFRNA